MELKVGMYVRYTRGAINGYVPPRIAKIVDCSDNELVRIDSWQVILRNDVIKASDNLIDLIEVGDYVNGYKVVRIFINVFNNQKVLVCSRNEKEEDFDYSDDISDYMSDEFIHIYNENIKNIVTKEQFNSVKYEVI